MCNQRRHLENERGGQRGRTDVELHEGMEEMLGGKGQRGENVAEDTLGAAVGGPHAAVEDGDESGLEVGILDVLGAAEKGDAEGDELVALRGGDDVGEVTGRSQWCGEERGDSDGGDLPEDELVVTHDVFEKVFGKTLEDFRFVDGKR